MKVTKPSLKVIKENTIEIKTVKWIFEKKTDKIVHWRSRNR